MHTVTKHLSFCYGHRLLNYKGKCRFLHGHNARVEVEVGKQKLDPRGMVIDFIEIKEILQKWIDQELDHRMLLHRDDPLLVILKTQGEPCFVMDTNPTAENIAKLIYDYSRKQGLPVTQVKLWETDTSAATYNG